MIKTLYYIEVLGCLSPLLTIFQLYHSAWSSVLLVEQNGKNHRAGFELTTLVVIGTDCTCSWKSNYHTIKMAIFIIILKACNRQYSDYSWSLFFRSLCILFIFYFCYPMSMYYKYYYQQIKVAIFRFLPFVFMKKWFSVQWGLLNNVEKCCTCIYSHTWLCRYQIHLECARLWVRVLFGSNQRI
jgi:hypothetical protein